MDKELKELIKEHRKELYVYDKHVLYEFIRWAENETKKTYN